MFENDSVAQDISALMLDIGAKLGKLAKGKGTKQDEPE
jgi:hypothetical protein